MEDKQKANNLSLQSLWFYIQPSYNTLEKINKVLTASKNLIGGQFINCLYNILSEDMDNKQIIR